jgi:excinuclease ABC subunit C
MIVVDQDGLSPKNYRKYNIRYYEVNNAKSLIDDYYMIKEVLTRRLKKIQQDTETLLPDVIIIDGGRGHFNVAEKIMKENKLESICLISVSKGEKRNAGREIIHTKNQNKSLKPNDPLLFFIQRIRDEAHRFVITAHRKRRKKKTFESIFDEIPGIGPKRKKTLKLHFGSMENIKNATLSELKKVKNLPISLINKIFDFFHS